MIATYNKKKNKWKKYRDDHRQRLLNGIQKLVDVIADEGLIAPPITDLTDVLISEKTSIQDWEYKDIYVLQCLYNTFFSNVFRESIRSIELTDDFVYKSLYPLLKTKIQNENIRSWFTKKYTKSPGAALWRKLYPRSNIAIVDRTICDLRSKRREEKSLGMKNALNRMISGTDLYHYPEFYQYRRMEDYIQQSIDKNLGDTKLHDLGWTKEELKKSLLVEITKNILSRDDVYLNDITKQEFFALVVPEQQQQHQDSVKPALLL